MLRLLLKHCLATALCACCSSAHAATLHHWRFEESPGFLQDSVGAAHLSASPAASQYALPAVGPGENFIGPFPGVGTNTSAAAFSGSLSNGLAAANSTPISGDFTIETLYHAASLIGTYGDVLASQAAGVNLGDVSWVFQVRLDGFAGTTNGELVLVLSDGTSFHAPLSGIIIQPGIDYYVAASFDRAGGQVTYRARDLTNGTPMQTVISAHSVPTLNQEAEFRIGDLEVNNSFAAHGIIDEVRLSDHVLSDDELLVPPIPEPGTLRLAALGLVVATLRRRTHDGVIQKLILGSRS